MQIEDDPESNAPCPYDGSEGYISVQKIETSSSNSLLQIEELTLVVRLPFFNVPGPITDRQSDMV